MNQVIELNRITSKSIHCEGLRSYWTGIYPGSTMLKSEY